MKDNIFSVSDYIYQHYGKSYKPNQKIKCVFCGKNTASIKGDDLIYKCFHPDCGKFINYSTANSNHLQKIFQEIFQDWNDYLTDKSTQSLAYRYLIERHIHPGVIPLSNIGVIPHNYNLNKVFNKYRILLEKEINDCKDNNKKPELEANLIKIEETKENFGNFIKNKRSKTVFEGDSRRTSEYLVFFYTDEFGDFTQIKVRKAYSKDIRIFKFAPLAGVFNNCIFSANKGGSIINDDILLIVEGEFNQLQLQSLLVRNGLDYINSCAVGGVTTADFKTIQKLSKKLLICYDNDESGAGLKLIENAIKYCNFKAFTTPEFDSDLDSYIKSFKNNDKEALNQVINLINNSNYYFKDITEVRKQTYEILDNRAKLKQHRINQKVWDFISSELESRGIFYYE